MSIPPTLAYSQVDVFAERRFEGNQLAIFHDATDLSADQMQAIARETNLSETTFIFPRDPHDEAENGVDVRIFTTQEELPFAGHPTLGTASWLYWNHPVLKGVETIKLRLKAGTIPVRFTHPAEDEAGVYAEMSQNSPVFGPTLNPGEVAQALGLRDEDLLAHLPPMVVSTGIAQCIVPMTSLDALSRLVIDQRSAVPYADRIGAKFFYCIAKSVTHADTWHARMQFYSGEDPATGSACGCAISYLVAQGVHASDATCTLWQGIEISRPSKLLARATLLEGGKHPYAKVADVRVGGRTIPAATGQLFLR